MRKSLALSERSESNGFTLVELLIVMGVLAVVVVTILVSLNPSEAGKKSRDVKRMKDLATLEAIILQYIQDGGEPFCTGTPGGCTSTAAGTNLQSQKCDASWIRKGADINNAPVDLCNYTKTVPVDPRNNVQTKYTDASNNPPISSDTTNFGYRITMSGSNYKIGGLQESISNVNNVKNDGGSYNFWVERGSDMNLW